MKVVDPAFFPLPVVLAAVMVDVLDLFLFLLPPCVFVWCFRLRRVFGAGDDDDEELPSSEDSRAS